MKTLNTTDGYQFIIDDEDFEEVSKYKWYFNRYVLTTSSKITKSLHRFIMKPKSNELIDHINRNTLDNRKCNLRICNYSENNRNRKSKNNVKGIRWLSNRNKWQARITINKKQIFLGYFDKKIDAINAYNNAALLYHKQFSKLNT